ncbi:efflux RND transporter periplasmic adaptor subunit [Rhodocytophaga aerolata]|uniref:Efflux RND transporter periplasmic adaptor subunit n=1 Tax=Rhodocytophaga aerolata TaxID=455078 RepID=A0ABT8RB94_9BACT|nr:efflux RND transporter periplasmic adaptor subunit [Rhodocytophaga aerolata]MDO1449269.1 efflux RND transporter periplasmic adaptor subunit [Rhodocytophaga aerolata]
MNITKHFSIYSFILFFFGIFLFEGCSQKKDEPVKTSKQASATAPDVLVKEAQADNPEYTLTLPGELLPYEQVAIFPKVKGFVKALYVDRGSQVKKGQLLALLEAPEITQQYLSAQAAGRKLHENYLYSKQSFERLQKASAKSGAVAAIELDKARTQLASDSAAYVEGKANTQAVAELKEYLSIRAPFTGTIIERNVSAGALVGENTGKGMALFTIAQGDRLRLTVAVPEKHAQSIQPHMQARFTVSSRPGKVFTSLISRNGVVLNSEQRSVTVEFDVDNQTKALNGGEYAQVQLMLRRRDSTLWVPVKSVVHSQSGVFLLKVQDGRVKRVPVSEGIRRDSLQEVFGDIAPGELIVVKGSEELADDTQVKTLTSNQQNQKVAYQDKE